jgi:hypothetical protein
MKKTYPEIHKSGRIFCGRLWLRKTVLPMMMIMMMK